MSTADWLGIIIGSLLGVLVLIVLDRLRHRDKKKGWQHQFEQDLKEAQENFASKYIEVKFDHPEAIEVTILNAEYHASGKRVLKAVVTRWGLPKVNVQIDLNAEKFKKAIDAARADMIDPFKTSPTQSEIIARSDLGLPPVKTNE